MDTIARWLWKLSLLGGLVAAGLLIFGAITDNDGVAPVAAAVAIVPLAIAAAVEKLK